jgi:23S rRNA pseudouridine1911/1915/1917 synthase
MTKWTTIFEDESILVIDKPAGLRVDHGDNEESVEDLVSFPVERHGIIHRLDKETSGVLILAKTPEAFESLKNQFKEHTTKKVYTTLVLGETEDRGEIKSFIARDPKRKQAMKVILYPTGQERGGLREAITNYRKVETYQFENYSLSQLEVEILTGRTHQIRVHLQSINHPVIGDQMYNSKPSKEISQKLGLERQFLHASLLEVTHPRTGERLVFKSDLPNDLTQTLERLKQ